MVRDGAVVMATPMTTISQLRICSKWFAQRHGLDAGLLTQYFSRAGTINGVPGSLECAQDAPAIAQIGVDRREDNSSMAQDTLARWLKAGNCKGRQGRGSACEVAHTL